MKNLKMIFALALTFTLAATTHAAPAGHQVCRGVINQQKIQLVFGTYANTGDAELSIDGTSFEFSAEFTGAAGGGLSFSARDSQVGSLRWTSSSEEATSILLSVSIGKTQFENKRLRCYRQSERTER